MTTLRQWWQRRQVARSIAQARRSGIGLYAQEWDLSAPDAEELSPVEAVLAWCRETLGRCRRPWGIDYFDLSIDCTDPQGQPLRSLCFSRIRPIDLYQSDDVSRRIAATLIGAVARGGAPLRVGASLFSWGDATYAAMPAPA